DSRGALDNMAWIRDRLTDADALAKVAQLEPLAKDMGATLAQFALAWCLHNPHVSSVITGASRVSQVQENLQALEFVDRFTPDVLAEIDRIFGP
ncbi:MAG TPA: aldo/keto reductase, partial [Xanthomonadales bacterium]|nr:aldo/keto reductase [Xanthomonadales bacterium]